MKRTVGVIAVLVGISAWSWAQGSAPAARFGSGGTSGCGSGGEASATGADAAGVSGV